MERDKPGDMYGNRRPGELDPADDAPERKY